MVTGTPRDLDPRFKNEKPETIPTVEEQERNENAKTDALVTEESQEKKDDDTPMIVHRERVMQPDGSVGEKIHGPMPVADWSAYEKENKL